MAADGVAQAEAAVAGHELHPAEVRLRRPERLLERTHPSQLAKLHLAAGFAHETEADHDRSGRELYVGHTYRAVRLRNLMRPVKVQHVQRVEDAGPCGDRQANLHIGRGRGGSPPHVRPAVHEAL